MDWSATGRREVTKFIVNEDLLRQVFFYRWGELKAVMFIGKVFLASFSTPSRFRSQAPTGCCFFLALRFYVHDAAVKSTAGEEVLLGSKIF